MTSKRIVGAVLVVALIAGGAWWARRRSAKADKTSSRVVVVTTGAIEETVEATGSVRPLNRVEVKPPIGGRIEKLLADEGDTVQQGQILAWMSSSDRAAIMDAARAQGPEALKRWEDTYKPTPIIAPLSGVLILRGAVVGETVDGGDVLFAMSDQLIVRAEVDESDIGRVRQGMPARLWLDAYPTRIENGRVFDILYEGKNNSNVIQYGVKVRPEKVPDYYRSQMTANVSFIVNRKPEALLIPLAAVHETASGGAQVFVPGDDGSEVARAIKTGVESGDKIEVLSGLQAGDRLLITQGKYAPQKALDSSPLAFTGPRRPEGQGQGTRTRKNNR